MHAPTTHHRHGQHPSVAMIVLLGAMTAFGAISIDLYLPAMPQIGGALSASPGAVQRTLSSLFAGLAIGQLLYGPLSDRIGRRLPILAGIALYVAASATCALAASVELLTVARFAQGFGACAALVVSRAVIRDRFDNQETARILSLIMLVFGVVPILAPLLGSYLLTLGDWRLIFWLLTGFGVIAGFAVALGLAESRSEETAARAASESPVGAFVTLLRDRRLLGYILCGAFNSTCLYIYLAVSPYLIIEIYGKSPQEFGWIFGTNAAGLVIGSQVNRRLLLRWSSDQVLAGATLLSIAAVALMLALSIAGVGGMWGALVPLFLILSCYGFMGSNTSAGALSVDPTRSGSISSLTGVAGFGIGAFATSLGGILHDGTARPMAAAMLAALLLSAAALFFLALPRRTRSV